MSIEERLENVIEILRLELADQQDEYTLDMGEMYSLVDGFNQHKAEMEEMRSAWRNYVDYLREKYPQPDGKFRFKCPHHHRINEVLK